MKTPVVQLYRGFGVVLTLLLPAFSPAPAHADVPSLLWLQTAGGSGAEVPHQIVVDNDSSSYVVGWFGSTNLSFGNGVVVSNAVRSMGAPNDGFIAKFNSNGAPVWARSFGGSCWSA